MRRLPNSRFLAAWTVAAVLTACGAGGDEGASSGASGKADDVETGGEEELVCPLDDSESRTFVQFVNQDHVQFRCRGPGGQFVDTICCDDQIREFELATGCPPQAKFNGASGSDKRCVEDEPDEIGAGEIFVPTICCQQLCDPAAGWDDPETQDVCRNSQGQFHPHVCCMMNDDLRCGSAQFDEQPDVNGFVHCRAQTGELAGQFAPAACCVDACFDIIQSGEHAVPIECVLPLNEECANTSVDANGLCRGDDGRFAKAACCLGLENLDVQASDDCRYAELIGDDLEALGCM